MRRPTQIILGSWCLMALACWAFFALAAAGVPGPYFDELVQAGPAADFLRNDWSATHLPEMVRVSMRGRPWPWMTTSYMGALKSQALIPSVALWGARTEVVRGSTLAWGLVGLLLAMLWVERVWGLAPALVMAAVLITDPSFIWIARHDWGSFALGFLLRMAGLWLITIGWQRGSTWWMGLAGIALGLTVYNKLDGAVFLLAAGGGAWVLGLVRSPGEATTKPRMMAALAIGLILGALPILLQATTALRVTSAAVTSRPQNYSEKLQALWRTLDGSYFERLMRAGGMFAEMYDVEGAARSPRGFLFVVAAVALGVLAWRAPSSESAWRGLAWVLGTWLVTTLGVLLTPDAARIHHHLLVTPLPALAVGLVAAAAWQDRATPWLRWSASLLLAILVATGVWQNARMAAWLRDTGGSGLWSSAMADWIERQQPDSSLGIDPAATQPLPVSLDWGFHEQLQFLAPDLQPQDRVWPIAAARAARQPIEMAGTERSIYLVHPPEYSLSSIGTILRGIAEQMPAELVRVEPLTNLAGELSAETIQFTRPHKITIDAKGEVGLELQPQ